MSRAALGSALLDRAASLVRSPHKAAFGRALLGSARLGPLSGRNGRIRGRARGGGHPAAAAPTAAESLERHREATYRWLCAAQDANADGGVAGFFNLWGGRWSESYPETTGYIIPTFLAMAEAGLAPDARHRALRMADWSCRVQLEDGAVLSWLIGPHSRPAVFNTGQAMFGWLSAYQVFGEPRYADSARAAGEWLLTHQDPDGAWRRQLSMVTTAPVHTYNGRCAWALAYAGEALGEPRFLEAAQRGSDWVLGEQTASGWFANNAFAEHEAPLLHTISYVIEGLIGVYAFSGEQRYLEAAQRALDPLVAARAAGPLAGRLDGAWQAAVPWRCPTGEAQVATALMRLERHCPGRGYAETARHLVADVAATQCALAGGTSVLASGGVSAGAVPGSFPIWGSYMRFSLPNWAAKFYLDALLLATAGIDEYGVPALPAA